MAEAFIKLYTSFVFIVFTVIIFIPLSLATSMGDLTLRVYEDGVIVVEDKIFPEIDYGNVTVKLLTYDVENILVISEDGKLVNYELNGDQLTIYGELPSQLTIHYETPALTVKNGSLWILEVYLPREAVVLMPSRSIIISLSNVPKMIAGEKDSLKLVLNPGMWKIEYIIQFTPRTSIQEGQDNSYMIVIPSLGGGAAALFSAIVYIRKKRNSSILLDDEKRVFELIKKRKKISEAEIRALTRLPKTTVWRIVRRLERKGLVRVVQVNKRNEVELA
ncbi:MAG: winged helix-turn-helix transcriptional regulator [Thaumarchaeota archaeon]|jgi:uncharacterized membrane protein|nr:winged helix-turn-helix transcriptional regulator [Candidatus Geocrenenecus arthurdayi]MCL7403413.1 winged helix-turn-helix transcriptional regulator [Candidatus Geocrenenecus arthurdayi]